MPRSLLTRPVTALWLGAALAFLTLLGVALPLTAQQAAKPDERVLERLEWMQQNEGNLWNITAEEGAFLRDLVVKVKAQRALELGTANGYSGMWIALGLRQTGGRLITMEIDQGRARLAQENFRAAGLAPLVTVARGDALQEIPKVPDPLDFVFIDVWKQGYIPCLKLVLPKVRPGGVIVAHNVTNLRDELADFIHEVTTNPQLKSSIENPGPGGFSVSYKR
jgi:predicted O-methyltransferase YrrM